MADSGLDLLFRLKAQNQASPVVKGLQGDIQKLRSSVTSDFGQMDKVTTVALGKITTSITNISSQVPILGSAVNALSGEMTELAAGTTTATSSFVAMAGPIGIAAAGMAATAIAAIKLGETLFDLAKQSADFQGKLFDLSQQTGVSVETLSALEIAASTTGGSIESVTASLGIFQKNMEEAGDANSKAAKQFDALGVQVTDTEDTLRKTLLALAKMPEGYRQTAAALELFGRGGKQVLAIIKETNGDLDQLIKKLRDQGLVTTEQARRADEFNDQLALLSFQLRGLGTEIIPGVTDAIKDLSKFLKDNKEGADALRGGLKLLADLFIFPFKGALQTAQVNIKAVTDALEFLRLKAKDPIVVEVEVRRSQTSGGALLEEVFKAGAPLGASRADIIAASEKAGLIKTTSRGGGLDAGQQLLQSLQRELRGLTEQTRAQEVAAELLDKKYKNLNPTLRAQIDLIARTIDVKKQEAEVDAKLKKDAEDRQREVKRQGEEITQFLQAQRAEIDQLNGVVVSTTDAAKQFFGTVTDAITEADKAVILANAHTIQFLRDVKSLKNVLESLDELTPGPTGGFSKSKGPLIPNIDVILGGPPPEAEKAWRGLQDALDGLGESLGKVFGASEDFSIQFGDVMRGAIDDLARGVGGLVEQWVLLGDTGPAAMRKLTASVLAGLAAQAATKAVFQLAEGFAALFFNPAEAAAHFTSAALFGSIAGVAAVAGRSVAGDLFKPNQGTSSGSTAQGQLNPLTLNRNQSNSTRTIVLQVQSNDSHIVKVVGANIRQAGDLREIIFNDGVS